MKIYLYQKQVDFLMKSRRFIITLMFLSPVSTFAQGNWSLISSLQMNSGKYIFDKTINTYYLNAGLRYKSEDWGLYATIPLIAQNTNMATYSGNMFIPTGHSNNESGQSNSHHGNMTNQTMSSSHLSFGLGDLYLYADYSLVKNQNFIPEILVTGQIKVPTASNNQSFGTGEFDFGTGLILRKQIDTYSVFLDVTYFKLGDPGEIKYKDPTYWGAGIGKLINNGVYSVSIYYSNYSRILSEFEGQQQISLALYYRLNNSQLLSISISRGFSETSPDLFVSGGIEISI